MLDRLLDACDLITDTIKNSAADIGLADVKFGGLPKLTKYPACMIYAGEMTRRPEASGQQTELTFNIMVFILHADLVLSREQRTREDLRLAEAVTDVLHADMTFGHQLAGSWVATEAPRPIPGKRAGQHVLTTELGWVGKSRGRIGA